MAIGGLISGRNDPIIRYIQSAFQHQISRLLTVLLWFVVTQRNCHCGLIHEEETKVVRFCPRSDARLRLGSLR